MIQTVDAVYRSIAYRLSEPGRTGGASVRYGAVGHCDGCQRVLRAETRAVRLADQVTWCCIGCGIVLGHLEPIDSERATARKEAAS